MVINIKLYGSLKRHAPGEGNEFAMTLSPGAKLADVIKKLSIPADKCVSLINGKRAIPSTLFKDGDTLVLFPPVSGG